MRKQCKFNPDQYSYSWGIGLNKTHVQKQCAECQLWTVYVNRKTGKSFSLCDGVEAVRKAMGEINVGNVR